MQGLNIHNVISPALNCITPLHDIIIKMYSGKTKDADCNWIASYDDVSAQARIQLENTQKLQHIQGLDLTKIYKRFYLNANVLTGLNRNLGSGGDYIYYNGLYYKIIEVKYNFETGWFAVIGCESAQLGE